MGWIFIAWGVLSILGMLLVEFFSRKERRSAWHTLSHEHSANRSVYAGRRHPSARPYAAQRSIERRL